MANPLLDFLTPDPETGEYVFRAPDMRAEELGGAPFGGLMSENVGVTAPGMAGMASLAQSPQSVSLPVSQDEPTWQKILRIAAPAALAFMAGKMGGPAGVGGLAEGYYRGKMMADENNRRNREMEATESLRKIQEMAALATLQRAKAAGQKQVDTTKALSDALDPFFRPEMMKAMRMMSKDKVLAMLQQASATVLQVDPSKMPFIENLATAFTASQVDRMETISKDKTAIETAQKMFDNGDWENKSVLVEGLGAVPVREFVENGWVSKTKPKPEKPDKPSYTWVRGKDGKQRRVVDQPGLVNEDAPPGYIVQPGDSLLGTPDRWIPREPPNQSVDPEQAKWDAIIRALRGTR